MKRKASALWQGDLKSGNGKISTDSGVLKDTQYSFSTRFESGNGTNPEELIAAAHAGCFAMALSSELGKAGLKPESIAATATVTLEMLPTGPTVTESHLDVTVKVPGADKNKVIEVANAAKLGCPISRLLNAKVTMDAKAEV
ncbi:MAG TPA: OsmC family protein [Candidatus Sulfotelmatobacter sp.]|jgi:osmotically inducible protein OsmC|nr:OsmC family protein [Candidatus Sulfotelmatobacter sp.]